MFHRDGDSGGVGGPAGLQDGEGGELPGVLLQAGPGQQVSHRVRAGEEGAAGDGVRESPQEVLRAGAVWAEQGGVRPHHPAAPGEDPCGDLQSAVPPAGPLCGGGGGSGPVWRHREDRLQAAGWQETEDEETEN